LRGNTQTGYVHAHAFQSSEEIGDIDMAKAKGVKTQPVLDLQYCPSKAQRCTMRALAKSGRSCDE